MSGEAARRKGDSFRGDIEGLRGVAVGLVVLFHAGLLSTSRFKVPGGFIGVDLFFVVSGFLITGLLIRERVATATISISRFYARRVRRILPAAAVVLVLTMPLAYLLVAATDRSSAMLDAAAACLSVGNMRFAVTTDYFNPTSYSPFLHFWSLGVEEQFYLIWPAVIILLTRGRVGPRGFLALAALALVSLAASLTVTNDDPSTAFYLLPTRAWQLCAGGLLAVVLGRELPVPSRWRRLVSAAGAFAGWSALGVLLLSAFTIDSRNTPYPGITAIPPTVAAVVLIGTGGLRGGPGLLLSVRPLRFLGRISYSLYLWHWPLLILGGLWLNGAVGGEMRGTQALGLAALSVPIAAVSWYCIEEPFRRRRIPGLSRPGSLVAIGMGSMVVIAMLGSTLDWDARRDLMRLQSSASRAQNGTATPGPYAVTAAVRPTLATAATDFERPVADNCLAGWGAVTPRTDCVYGTASGSQTIALIGDSHASALFPAIEALAVEHGWRLEVFLKRGCPFIDMPTFAANLKREYTECQAWNASVVARLRARPPSLILVSQLRSINALHPSDASAASKGAAFAREIDQLPAAARTLVIEDPPFPGTKIPACLAAHLDDYRPCDFSRAVAGATVGKIESIAAASTGVGLVDISAAVCPSSTVCPVVIRNIIVWRDDTHLTATFAATLAPAFESKVGSAMQTVAATSARDQASKLLRARSPRTLDSHV